MNPTVVMAKMGIKDWFDPAKSGPIVAKIPQGKYTGDSTEIIERNGEILKWRCVGKYMHFE